MMLGAIRRYEKIVFSLINVVRLQAEHCRTYSRTSSLVMPIFDIRVRCNEGDVACGVVAKANGEREEHCAKRKAKGCHNS